MIASISVGATPASASARSMASASDSPEASGTSPTVSSQKLCEAPVP